jgi:hypothetical protein
LAVREKLFGAGAPVTLEAASALAATLAQMNQVPEALALQDAVIDAQQRQLGNEHLATVESLAVRADILCHGEQLEGAVELLEQVLALRSRLLGPEHADTVRTRKVLAQARNRLRQPEPAAARDMHGRENGGERGHERGHEHGRERGPERERDSNGGGVEQPHAAYPQSRARRVRPDELAVNGDLSPSRLR